MPVACDHSPKAELPEGCRARAPRGASWPTGGWCPCGSWVPGERAPRTGSGAQTACVTTPLSEQTAPDWAQELHAPHTLVGPRPSRVRRAQRRSAGAVAAAAVTAAAAIACVCECWRSAGLKTTGRRHNKQLVLTLIVVLVQTRKWLHMTSQKAKPCSIWVALYPNVALLYLNTKMW